MVFWTVTWVFWVLAKLVPWCFRWLLRCSGFLQCLGGC